MDLEDFIGFLLATKNKDGWFVTKDYVDGSLERFSLLEETLLADDISQELVSEMFSVDDGYLTFNTTDQQGAG